MKHLLIVGAKSDIALAVAEVYAQNGYQLSLAARNVVELEDFANDLAIRAQTSINLMELDVCDHQSHAGFIKSLATVPSGILTAVGYLGDQKLAQRENGEANKILEANYLGISQLLNQFANMFEQRGNGFIVGISSVAGDRGRQSNYFYGAAKAAFSTYLAGLRNRLYSANVQVLDVRPGFVATKMTADMDLPAALTASAGSVAEAIFKAQQKDRSVIYVKPVWKLIMLVIRHIPESIFKRFKL